jgi:hypothetical protein
MITNLKRESIREQNNFIDGENSSILLSEHDKVGFPLNKDLREACSSLRRPSQVALVRWWESKTEKKRKLIWNAIRSIIFCSLQQTSSGRLVKNILVCPPQGMRKLECFSSRKCP